MIAEKNILISLGQGYVLTNKMFPTIFRAYSNPNAFPRFTWQTEHKHFKSVYFFQNKSINDFTI